MVNEKTVAVVVKAYNEEKQIRLVFEEMPEYVDRIIVVNDGSQDNTAGIVADYIDSCEKGYKIPATANKQLEQNIYNRADIVLAEIRANEEKSYPAHKIYNDNDNDRIVLINSENSGPGGAVSLGYKWCRDHGIDCTVVIDGDGQMDPSEMKDIIRPVVYEEIDYVKGNRLQHPASRIIVPQIRYFGNNILSLLTKIASGYWSVSDTQTGYTAISLNALERIPIHEIYHSYGYPNDLLVKLNIANCILGEVPIKPVYDIGEQSKMKIIKVIPRLSILLIKDFMSRIWRKYLINSFHPLFIFYFTGFLLSILNLPVIIKIIWKVIVLGGSVTTGWYMTFLLLALFSFQSIGFGLWMDMQDNMRLEMESR